MPRKLEFSSYLAGKTAHSIPAEDRDRRGFVLQAQRTLSIKGTLIQQKTIRFGSVSVDRGASLQRMALECEPEAHLTPLLLGTENVHNVTAELNVLLPGVFAFQLRTKHFHGHISGLTCRISVVIDGRRIVEAIPNADGRLILEIRHRHLRAIVQAELGHIEKRGNSPRWTNSSQSRDLGPEMTEPHGYT
jgi:hypothetical protein